MSDLDLMRPTVREVRAFYQTKEWRNLRGHALHLAGHRCEAVDEAGRRCEITANLEVDHFVPVRACWAGRLELRNLRVLCHHHHRSEKKRQEARQWPR